MSRVARRAGLEIGDAAGPRDRVGGLGQGHRRPGPGGPDPHGASTDRAKTRSRWRASCRQKAFASLAQATHRRRSRSFDESQRLFRLAGMKNAACQPGQAMAPDRACAGQPRRRPAGRRGAGPPPPGALVARQAGRRARFYRNDLPHVLRERAHLAALAGRRRRARSSLRPEPRGREGPGCSSRGVAYAGGSRRARTLPRAAPRTSTTANGPESARGTPRSGRGRSRRDARQRRAPAEPWAPVDPPFTRSSRTDSSDPEV